MERVKLFRKVKVAAEASVSQRGKESITTGEMEGEQGRAGGSQPALPALENGKCVFVFSNSCHSVLSSNEDKMRSGSQHTRQSSLRCLFCPRVSLLISKRRRRHRPNTTQHLNPQLSI